MEKNSLTDQEIRKVLKKVEEKGELLKLAQDCGVKACKLQRIIESESPIGFDERFLLTAVIGE